MTHPWLQIPLADYEAHMKLACHSLCAFAALLAVPSTSQFVVAGETGGQRASLPELQYVDRQSLPDFEIGGRPVRIHTQGLFVTNRHYYITGRLQRNPKRPLLVRFDRAHLSDVEHVDLLITAGATTTADAALDHPGGFDFDGKAFWIPVAISRPYGKSLILRVESDPGQPLAAVKAKIAFRVDDHIGAIACDRTTGRLYGANWDTRFIYVWKTDGTIVERFAQTDLSPKRADRALAVQDWKGIGRQRILAGGLDKSSHGRTADPKAVLQLIDVGTKSEVGRIGLIPPPHGNRLPTQEGMAVLQNDVYFLPGDLGTNAEVYRYRWSKPWSWEK